MVGLFSYLFIFCFIDWLCSGRAGGINQYFPGKWLCVQKVSFAAGARSSRLFQVVFVISRTHFGSSGESVESMPSVADE